MKKITRYAHNIVRQLHLANIIAEYSDVIPILWKLLPTNQEYLESDIKRVNRGGANFELQVRDYMQWHVYANLPEPLWQKAWENLTDNATILDVEANIGAFTFKTSSYLKKIQSQYNIFAIEPNPLIVNKLKRNHELNPEVQSHIQIAQIAFSDSKGEMNIDTNNTNSGGSKLTPVNTGIKVKVDTLDSFVFKRNLINIELIKIDVEGFEPNVLRGALNTIENFRPKLIIEITDQWFKNKNSSAHKIIEYFLDLNYTIVSDANGKIQKILNLHNIPPVFQFNILVIPNK